MDRESASIAKFATTVRANIKFIKKHRRERMLDSSTVFLRSTGIFNIAVANADGT